MNRLRLLRALQLLAAGVSSLTTMLGFLHLTGASTWLSVVGALLFSVIVQALVVVTADSCTRPSLRLRWALSIALYCVVAFVSSVFSIGFYFDLFAADDFADAQFRRQGDRILAEATRVDAEFAEVVAKLDLLSVYAEEKRILEATVGKTCAHSQGAGRGPAMAKRDYEARRVEELAETYRRRRVTIARSVEEIQTARASVQPRQVPSIEVLRQPWNSIQAALRGADLRPITEPMIAYESAGYPEDDPRFGAFAGPEYACRDGGTIARLQGLLDTPVPVLAPIPLKQLDASDPKQVIFLVFNGLLDAIFVGPGHGPDVAELAITDREFLPALAFGVVVDLAILVLGLLLVAARDDHNGSPPTRLVQVAADLVGPWHRVRRMLERAGALGVPAWNGDDMGDVRELVRELRQHLLVRRGERSWLIVPKPSREDRVFDGGHRFSRPFRELLDQAVFVLQQERVVRRTPSRVPKGVDPAALLAGRFAPLAAEAMQGTPGREEFVAYEVFIDLDELERNTPASGAVAGYERMLGDEMPSWLPRTRQSRFFAAVQRGVELVRESLPRRAARARRGERVEVEATVPVDASAAMTMDVGPEWDKGHRATSLAEGRGADRPGGSSVRGAPLTCSDASRSVRGWSGPESPSMSRCPGGPRCRPEGRGREPGVHG